MKKIRTLNKISESGLAIFGKEKYIVDDLEKNPDALLLRSFDLHQFEISKETKAIARAGAGVNNIPVEYCSECAIAVFNTPGANANAVKELVLTSLIASSRNLFDAVAWTKTFGNQENIPKLVEAGKKKFVGREIEGKTLGVIGLGAVGALVANDALELGMDVIGYDPFVSVETAWKLSRNIRRAMTLEEVYANSDYITIHVPLTENTKEMLDVKAFNLMKKGLHLLNFSRGELVNEKDIADALENEKIAKYITDFPNESVLKMKNTIALPHLGASTEESEENCAIMAARELKEYLETGNVKNSVNFPDAHLPYTGKCRVAVFHRNIPNMVSQITNILSDHALNIADMINKSRGGFAYTMIDLDEILSNGEKELVKEKMEKIQGVLRIRLI